MTMNVDQQYQNPSTGKIVGGAFAGAMAAGTINHAAKLSTPLLINKMVKVGSNISIDEFQQLSNATKKILETSGLSTKGTQIIDASKESLYNINKTLISEYKKTKIGKLLPKRLKKCLINMQSTSVKFGTNAFFLPNLNKLIVSQEKFGLAVFHEVGHAMNKNIGKFGKILAKSRMLALAAAPITLISLFKTKKAEGEQPKGKLDKATTFIKNNAGKLTFAAFLPVLLEEGMATIKGNKLAKKLLSPELAKKVAKINALGFASYLLTAAASGLAIYLGVKVKDAIAHRKIAKQTA